MMKIYNDGLPPGVLDDGGTDSFKGGRLDPLDILLVEDNEVTARMIGLILKKAGHRHEWAADGSQALEILKSRRMDAVLMDLEMPVMDGLSATERIRSSSGWASPPDVPVIALTANSLRGDQEKIRATGMNDCIQKPVDASTLVRALARVTAKRLDAKFAAEAALAAAIPSEDMVLDRVMLLERLGGSRESFKQVAGLFLKNAPKKINALRTADESGDLGELARLAHSIKGLGMQMGAGRTKNAAAALEQVAKEGNLALARSLRLKLNEALDELLTEIADAVQDQDRP